MDTEKAILGIIDDIREGFGKSPVLSRGSARLVGSLYNFAEEGIKDSRTYDLDILAIFPEITKEIRKSLAELGSEIQGKRSGSGLEVMYNVSLQPVKLKPSGDRVRILVHMLAYDDEIIGKKGAAGREESFSETVESRTSPCSWRNYTKYGRDIYGKMPDKYKVYSIGLKDVLSPPHDPDSMVKQIRNDELFLVDPETNEQIRADDSDKVEMYAYNVISLASNMVVAMKEGKTGFFERSRKGMEAFAEIFSDFELKDFPLEMYELKERLRKGERIEPGKLKEKTILFIRGINELVEKSSE